MIPFSDSEIKQILMERYNMNAEIVPLAGEVDYNFKVSASNVPFLFKICRPDVSELEVQFQIDILNHLEASKISIETPSVVASLRGEKYFFISKNENKYIARLHTWVEGKMLDSINPRTQNLYRSWGATCGLLSNALSTFDHKGAHRFDKWNPVESLYSKKYLQYINNDDQKELAVYFWDIFENSVPPISDQLRHSVNYSDAHEHNLLLENDYQQVSGVIDFGDAIYSPTICELAIACAYAGMHVNDPIEAMSFVVQGFHEMYALEEKEVEILLPMVIGRLLITVANAAYNVHNEPQNEYLQISADPAWALLKKLKNINLRFVQYYFRAACKWDAHPNRIEWEKWFELNKNSFKSPINLIGHKTMNIDLSVGSLDLGNNSNFESIHNFERRINRILDEKSATLAKGGYKEVRPFYTTDAYKIEGNNGPRWRTMHLGTDYWTSAGTAVVSVANGVIHSLQNNDADCDYGPTIIIKHKTDFGLEYFTLYGHLSIDSLDKVVVGDSVRAGDKIAEIGQSNINGGWPPHLHFQVILDLMDFYGDFPGVCFVEESQIWTSICPNISNEIKEKIDDGNHIEGISAARKKLLGKSLSVSYNRPLHIVRGYKQYLYDISGRRYLDMVNNVAHVGHEHPRVVEAAIRQIELLNTNTRYINENITKYAEFLLSKCPSEHEVVYFVNSGSEANELAMRMAKVYSKQKDMIAIEAGYHGNTGATVDVSSYKFDGKGGQGKPEYTSILPMPDLFRGACQDNQNASEYYNQYLKKALVELKAKGRNVAGFIVESILSCGGQVTLPDNYLNKAFEIVREEGGLCISDEVQVGFGRVGSHYWAFELQGVVPDIITCGKPIGNGHPLGAVITTRKVAEAFENGMEYFNTFGGNPVSCAIGYEVLSVIDDEGLKENALIVGNYLLKKFEDLKVKHALIGDVRGAGLFCGLEFVKNRDSLEPAASEAKYIVNRMKELGILLSTDGPLKNVIKMKPPLCFTVENANEMVNRLDKVLLEVSSIAKIKKWK